MPPAVSHSLQYAAVSAHFQLSGAGPGLALTNTFPFHYLHSIPLLSPCSPPQVRELLGGLDLPLIWTADFILDTAPNDSDAYR